MTTETEVARIERGEAAGLAELGLRLVEVKRLVIPSPGEGDSGGIPRAAVF
jgi:hypothetical protein